MNLHQTKFLVSNCFETIEDLPNEIEKDFFINDIFQIKNKDNIIKTILSSNCVVTINNIYICDIPLEHYSMDSFSTYNLIGVNFKVDINIKYVGGLNSKGLFFHSEPIFYTEYISLPDGLTEKQLKDLTKKNKLWAASKVENFTCKLLSSDTVSFSLLGLLDLHIEQ